MLGKLSHLSGQFVCLGYTNINRDVWRGRVGGWSVTGADTHSDNGSVHLAGFVMQGGPRVYHELLSPYVMDYTMHKLKPDKPESCFAGADSRPARVCFCENMLYSQVWICHVLLTSRGLGVTGVMGITCLRDAVRLGELNKVAMWYGHCQPQCR